VPKALLASEAAQDGPLTARDLFQLQREDVLLELRLEVPVALEPIGRGPSAG
jgi:hypothetical protein